MCQQKPTQDAGTMRRLGHEAVPLQQLTIYPGKIHFGWETDAWLIPMFDSPFNEATDIENGTDVRCADSHRWIYENLKEALKQGQREMAGHSPLILLKTLFHRLPQSSFLLYNSSP
jgi:hypothetical protein